VKKTYTTRQILKTQIERLLQSYPKIKGLKINGEERVEDPKANTGQLRSKGPSTGKGIAVLITEKVQPGVKFRKSTLERTKKRSEKPKHTKERARRGQPHPRGS